MFLGKFQGHVDKIFRVNSIRFAKPLKYFNIVRAIPPQVTSSWAIFFFELNLRIPYLVYNYILFIPALECAGWMDACC